jgi:DME family drug/metabolite transporter
MSEINAILFAVLAALIVAMTSVAVRIGTEKSRSSDILAVVVIVNLIVFIPLAFLIHYPNYGLTSRSVGAFIAAGIAGTVFARSLYYEGIRHIGASRAEPIKASNPVLAAIAAVILLGETLSIEIIIGILMIVAGVALVSVEIATHKEGLKGSWRGVLITLFASFFYALDPVFNKMGLEEGTPILVGLALKATAGGIVFFAYLWWSGKLPKLGGVDGSQWKWMLIAAICNTGFLVAYFVAISSGPVTIVFPIMQTSPLLVAGISFLFLQKLEKVTFRLVMGAVVVVIGAVLLTLLSFA